MRIHMTPCAPAHAKPRISTRIAIADSLACAAALAGQHQAARPENGGKHTHAAAEAQVGWQQQLGARRISAANSAATRAVDDGPGRSPAACRPDHMHAGGGVAVVAA